MFQKARLLCLLIILVLSSATLDWPKTLTSQEILGLVNQDREKHGLPSLDLNSSLNMAANLKAVDMIKKNYFAHVSPEGLKPWHWFKVSGYDYTYAGENLAIGFTSAAELQSTWMKSPQHRANILSPFYSELGLAILARNESFVVVEFFGSKTNSVSLRQ